MDINETVARINELKKGEWYSYHHALNALDQWTCVMQSAARNEYMPIHEAIQKRRTRCEITLVQEKVDNGFIYYAVGI